MDNKKFLYIPLALFENELYKNNLSLDAKILYSLLLNRKEISQSNNKNFIIFTRKEAAEILCISYKTAVKAFQELINTGLIEEKAQGFGNPKIIYVCKIF